jgi:chromosome partitioning protein
MNRVKGKAPRRLTAPPENKVVISIIQQKGGVGKTTLTVHLAHMIAALRPKWKVAVADADSQQSAMQWINRGRAQGISSVTGYCVAQDGEGKSLRKDLSKIDADIVLIDLPPAIESISLRAALYADIMLVPVGASTLDIEAAKAAVNVCHEAQELDPRKRLLLVPSRVRTQTASARDLRPVLEQWGEVSNATIALRVAYSDAATYGEGIDRFAPNTTAYREMAYLCNEVLGLIED